ncbi:UNVERIFIED_CONTAM: hypothetical protein Sangu_1023300 [Sesamum angustifolium]|uniref:Retrovirus-related Pol polyprotein from transposon TNT 1-94-like beta-barrel domain-containing protein n=1 Tax=Sesamum angustifolium TaxID=2727405 RepID=A0AAW2NVQ5_9LAMI
MEPSSSTGIKMMNQEFVKLSCFNGTNYSRQNDKMMFLLTFLKIAYVLDVNHPPTQPQEGDTDQLRITVHVCNDKNRFKHYEDAANGQQVLMENTNTTIVLDKGNVEVQSTSEKKLLLTNVLHVLEIRKNLVSAVVLSKKGLKTMIEADKLIVTKN